MLALISTSAQNVITMNAEGNLESPRPLECVDLSEVTNMHNPADILTGMRKCISDKNYKKAVKLFSIAGVFGRYDSFRVKDKTAHQALMVLQENIFSDIEESERDALINLLNSELQKGSSSLNQLCENIKKIGVPKYFPRYMIQHGIQAFMAENDDDGLVENFDSQKSWNLALKEYLHCGNLE